MKGGFKPRLKFPVVTINADGTASFSRDEKNTFVKWTKSVAKNEKYYKGLKILDATGQLYKIVKVEILSYSNFFWGLDVFLGQSVIADTFVELAEIPSLSVVKSILGKAVTADRDYYESAGINWKDLQLKITEAKGPQELFELLADAQGAEKTN